MTSSSRYQLVYVLKPLEGGSGLHARYMAQTYPESFEAVDFKDIQLHEEDFKEDDTSRRIWLLHNPFFYKKMHLCVRWNDFSCLRAQFTSCTPGKHLTNGWSYFKRNLGRYHGWLPTIYQSEFQRLEDDVCVGYYIRDVRAESNLAFADFIKSIPDVPIMTIGTKDLLRKQLSKHSIWTHTYDSSEFWKKCSHYFYFRPCDIEDPMPHTLLEAVQSRHQIISLKNPRRKFTDGIDDILSCLDDYSDTMKKALSSLQESCAKRSPEALDPQLWKPYIQNLCETRFNYRQTASASASRDLSLCQWVDKNLRK